MPFFFFFCRSKTHKMKKDSLFLHGNQYMLDRNAMDALSVMLNLAECHAILRAILPSLSFSKNEENAIKEMFDDLDCATAGVGTVVQIICNKSISSLSYPVISDTDENN